MNAPGQPPFLRGFRRTLRVFGFALAVALVLLTTVTVALTVGDGIVSTLTWLLVPGLFLYDSIHGSLLSGGSGMVGDFLIVVMGSAVAWSALYTVIHVIVSAVVRRST